MHLYLKTIKLKFTAANVINKNKFVRLATNSISPIKVKIIVNPIINKTATQGVLVLLWIRDNTFGRDFSFAIPYIILDVATIVIKIVLEVENKAIIASKINALLPNTAAATLANGALLWLKFSHPITLTAETATKT